MKCRDHDRPDCPECIQNPDAVYKIKAGDVDVVSAYIDERLREITNVQPEPVKPMPWDELLAFINTLQAPAPVPIRFECGRWMWETLCLNATPVRLRDWRSETYALFGVPIVVRDDFPWTYWRMTKSDGSTVDGGWLRPGWVAP